jgi:hypothetical protein
MKKGCKKLLELQFSFCIPILGVPPIFNKSLFKKLFPPNTLVSSKLLASPTEDMGTFSSKIHSISQSVSPKNCRTAKDPTLPLPIIVNFIFILPP